MFDVPVYLIACKNKKCCPDFVAARNIDSIPTRSSDSISAGNDESPIRNNDSISEYISISAGNDESENETENDVLFLESNDNSNNMNATTVCVCVNSGLTSLSTIFQSYHDGVWLRQGAQCSLL